MRICKISPLILLFPMEANCLNVASNQDILKKDICQDKPSPEFCPRTSCKSQEVFEPKTPTKPDFMEDQNCFLEDIYKSFMYKQYITKPPKKKKVYETKLVNASKFDLTKSFRADDDARQKKIAGLEVQAKSMTKSAAKPVVQTLFAMLKDDPCSIKFYEDQIRKIQPKGMKKRIATHSAIPENRAMHFGKKNKNFVQSKPKITLGNLLIYVIDSFTILLHNVIAFLSKVFTKILAFVQYLFIDPDVI